MFSRHPRKQNGWVSRPPLTNEIPISTRHSTKHFNLSKSLTERKGKGEFMKRLFVAALSTLALAVAVTVPSRASNIALTGHDDDFHCGGGSGDPEACPLLKAIVNS